MEYREKYCHRCRRSTLHSRESREGVSRQPAVAHFLTGLGAIWCLWPFLIVLFILIMPLWLVVWLVYEGAPFRCDECGRRNWRPGGEPKIADQHHRSGPDYHYDEIRLVRRSLVDNENDLIKPLTQIVQAIQREGPSFRLLANSPAQRLYSVRTGWRSNVWKFVTTSEIQWGSGREPGDPTHEVFFFNWPRSVCLKIQFVVAGVEANCPALVTSLMLRTDDAVHSDGDRTARLDRLFSRLIEILAPDDGCVLLPGQPDSSSPPNQPIAGWLTYLKRTDSVSIPKMPPPSVAVPFAAGVKIRSMPGPAPEDYASAAAAIT